MHRDLTGAREIFGFGSKTEIPPKNIALEGRPDPIATAPTHFVNDNPLKGPYPEGSGMGCFGGVERIFWKLDGVIVTAVGYAAGHTPNATYQEVCTGRTGHNEVLLVVFDPVLVVFDPAKISYQKLLKAFWEGHDPTQGMRQGNDTGTQYRSGIYTFNEAQRAAAATSLSSFRESLFAAGLGKITTEILAAPEFHFADDYHQQYLAKNPAGYCGIGGTGVSCPISNATS